MRGDHTFERKCDIKKKKKKGRRRKEGRGTVFLPDGPMRIQYTPTRLGLCEATAAAAARSSPCDRVHPLPATATLRSLNPGHAPRRL